MSEHHKPEKPSWGGKREGAGWRNRPKNPEPTVTVSCRVSLALRDKHKIDSSWLKDAIAIKLAQDVV